MPAYSGIARATPTDVAAEIRKVTGGLAVRPGRVKLDLPVLVENGGAVAMSVSVPTPPANPSERVRSIHVFAEGNPLPQVAHFHFGPRSGRPRVATRIRLATSQTVIAIAKLEDGSCWRDSVDLIVTIAACLE
jgi:sulfur-oxidizing protein SoxY